MSEPEEKKKVDVKELREKLRQLKDPVSTGLGALDLLLLGGMGEMKEEQKRFLGIAKKNLESVSAEIQKCLDWLDGEKKKFILLAVFVFCAGMGFAAAPVEIEPSSFPLPDNPASFNKIKVGILLEQEHVDVFSDAPYKVQSLQTGALIVQGQKLSNTRIVPAAAGIRFGGRNLPIPGLQIFTFGSPIRVAQTNYRENVIVLKSKSGKLTVVNQVNIEEYLKGVLPKEMFPTWPIEALKAQAVASRTFALFQSLSKSKEAYMLAGDVIGQMYGGHGSEKAETTRAVTETRGEILTHKGQIFPAYFHSTCGGKTTVPEYNWDIQAHPVLKGGVCPYCVSSKHFFWQRSIPLSEIEKKLNASGKKVLRVREVIPQKPDASGRAREILIRHSLGNLVLRGNDFRLIVGPGAVRSLKDLRVQYSGDQVLFSGYGWGHGVGMCQWGVKAMADQGKNYKEILEFYYPGSKMTRLRATA